MKYRSWAKASMKHGEVHDDEEPVGGKVHESEIDGARERRGRVERKADLPLDYPHHLDEDEGQAEGQE